MMPGKGPGWQLCPLGHASVGSSTVYCQGEKCMWWDEDCRRCFVVTAARALDQLRYVMEQQAIKAIRQYGQ